MKTNKTYAIVTGASQGLGLSFSHELARKQHNLLLLSRPNEGLAEIAQNIRTKYHVEVNYLEIDLSEVAAISKVELWINQYPVNILINNAGIGGASYFNKTQIDVIESILSVNIRALVMITRSVIDNLKKHAPGYILNISSMASCCPIAFKTVYPASKSFVYSFSRSLGEELKEDNIHVSVVLPGAFRSNSNVCKRIDVSNWWIKLGCVTPPDLARIVIKQFFEKRRVIIPGILNKFSWLVLKIMPRSISIPAISHSIRDQLKPM